MMHSLRANGPIKRYIFSLNFQDQQLQILVQQYGPKNWKSIAEKISGRNAVQCLHRWSKILKPGLRKGPWTQEEDNKLQEWISKYGPRSWAKCAKYIPGRSGKQVRERWFNILEPSIKKGCWTYEEDLKIYELFGKYGSKWAQFSKQVEGRTENALKNRFYSTTRRIASKIGLSKLKDYLAQQGIKLDENMIQVPLHEIFILYYFQETKELILEYLRMLYKVNRDTGREIEVEVSRKSSKNDIIETSNASTQTVRQLKTLKFNQTQQSKQQILDKPQIKLNRSQSQNQMPNFSFTRGIQIDKSTEFSSNSSQSSDFQKQFRKQSSLQEKLNCQCMTANFDNLSQTQSDSPNQQYLTQNLQMSAVPGCNSQFLYQGNLWQPQIWPQFQNYQPGLQNVQYLNGIPNQIMIVPNTQILGYPHQQPHM